jgi:hypothetical protein
MDKKYQVFVSSTYEDLKEHRDQAVKTILRMGHLPVGMEMFNAADSTQWEIIKRHIDNSDYYVVVLAHRYGSMDEEGISYTEKEYDYALEKGVPCLGFVIDSSVNWSPSLMAKGDDAVKLEAFKTKIKSRMVSFWTSSDNLALHISASLSEVFNTKPRIGWVRSNEVTTSPLVAEELSRLSKRNEELTAQLALRKQGPDELDEAIIILKNLRYNLKSSTDFFEKSLWEIFLAACTSKYGIYPESVLEELFEESLDAEESNIEPAFKELILLNLLDYVDSYNYVLTLKGKQVYTRIRLSLYQEE